MDVVAVMGMMMEGGGREMHTPLVAVRTLLRGHLLYPLVVFCKVLF